MSEAKFTKGPWEIDGYFQTSLTISQEDDEGSIICDVESGYDVLTETLDPTEEQEANAYLIAAAPRTYFAADELIKSIMDKHGLKSIDELECPLMKELALSLVEARGEDSNPSTLQSEKQGN